MLKQEKSLKFKINFKNKPKEIKNINKIKKSRKFLSLKNISRVRKVIRHNANPFNFFTLNSLKNKFSKKINIRITANNIFCTLIDLKTKQTLHVGSGGKYKIKTSKKKLRYNSKIIVELFFKDINKKINSEEVLINLIAPIKIKKLVLKQLYTFFKKYTNLTINVTPKKCFNGCRPAKKIRKRKKGLRIFK